jgi:transcriptional regulator with XRE-family HTH domain
MMDGMKHTVDSLGASLRAWRDRLAPQDVGITATHARRARGLRREELAQLAGLSVGYIVRLEQGRAVSPSAQVVGALARALQLSRTERDYLYVTAGLLPPPDAQIDSHIPPSVQRVVSRLGNAAFAVFRADWQLLTWNPLWAALQGDPLALPVAERNLLKTMFLDGPAKDCLRITEVVGGDDVFLASLVADLRVTVGHYPRDRELAALIANLQANSPTFRTLWASGVVDRHESATKIIRHPDVGTISLDLDVMTVRGADLRIVVYTAAANSEDSTKLELIRMMSSAAAPHRDTELPSGAAQLR